MKKTCLTIFLIYHFLTLSSFIERCYKSCTLANCVVIAMLAHSIWTWHSTRVELKYCEQALKDNRYDKDLLIQEWCNQKFVESSKERDTTLSRKEYCELLRNYSTINRTLWLRQMRATLRREQSVQGILSGIAGHIVTLF